MAIRPDYTIGTLTLTSGSANFTTSGSALQTAAVQAGDEIITRSGDVLIIATITGQNSGTLFQNCPASAAGVGQPLRVRFQPDGSRYQGAVRDLIEKLASGNVEALAGITGATKTLPYFTGAGSMDALVGAANTMPYFTGVNGMGVTALTAFARSLLDDPDASSALSTLGASAFGKALIALTGTNGNLPVMTGAGTVASRPIVGTVSQSGGIPTGGIIERGSNANGEYVRLADGTQVCWFVSMAGRTFTTSQTGGGYRTDALNYTYPAAFVAAPAVMAMNNGNLNAATAAGSGFPFWAPGTGGSTTTLTMYMFSMNNASVTGFMYVAIGRWF